MTTDRAAQHRMKLVIAALSFGFILIGAGQALQYWALTQSAHRDGMMMEALASAARADSSAQVGIEENRETQRQLVAAVDTIKAFMLTRSTISFGRWQRIERRINAKLAHLQASSDTVKASIPRARRKKG